MTTDDVLNRLKAARQRIVSAADSGYRLAVQQAKKSPDDSQAFMGDLGFRLIQAQAKVTEIEALLCWHLGTEDHSTAVRMGSKFQALDLALTSLERLVKAGVAGRWRLKSSVLGKASHRTE